MCFAIASAMLMPISVAASSDAGAEGSSAFGNYATARAANLGESALTQAELLNVDIDKDNAVTAVDCTALKRLALTAEEAVTTIVFSDSEVKITGENASANGGVVTLSGAGPFEISGKTANGQIVIDSTVDVDITLMGLELTNTTGPAIYGIAGDTTIKVKADTENVLTDGEVYADITQTACIQSADRLTFKGGGSLTVNSAANFGISGNDEVKVKNGNISIDSFGDALRAKDFVEITGGTLNIKSADGDGIKSTKGYVVINQLDGETVVLLDADADALQAETYLSIASAHVEGSGKRGITALTGTTLDNADVYLTSKNAFDTTLLETNVYTMLLNFEQADYPSGTELQVEDNNYAVILKMTAQKKFQYVLIADDSLTAGLPYSINDCNGSICHWGSSSDTIFKLTELITSFDNVYLNSPVVTNSAS